MGDTILLYGATGFSGRLIAAEGERAGMGSEGGAALHMVLAGRDGRRLRRLADTHGMEYRSFSLDDRGDVRRGLRDVDLLINAAGPFAWTADRLVKAALDEGCHYVDINGEVDVYKKLDDLGRHAARRGLAMVCSAGHTAAASDLLLEAALDQLRPEDLQFDRELGAVRIAMSRVMSLSPGSAETVWRSLREQVTVVQMAEVAAGDKVVREPRLWHEPVGRLERTFDFRGPDGARRDLRIASAANLVDTLTARRTVARKKFSAKRIESYVEAGTVARMGYQLGSLLAPLAAIPVVRALTARTAVVDWWWETPNAYQFTAQVVVAIAGKIAADGAAGWLTPGEVLQPRRDPATGQLAGASDALRDCRLNDRRA
jgi:saccharopine dehydrogenase (NAD+, L-lysine-forming)